METLQRNPSGYLDTHLSAEYFNFQNQLLTNTIETTSKLFEFSHKKNWKWNQANADGFQPQERKRWTSYELLFGNQVANISK